MRKGPDTKVELVSSDGSNVTARVVDLRIAPHHNQVSATVAFAAAAASRYSLKVTSAGQTVLLPNAIRLE